MSGLEFRGIDNLSDNNKSPQEQQQKTFIAIRDPWDPFPGPKIRRKLHTRPTLDVKTSTVKSYIFVCPLFPDLSKFVKITGRKYLNGNLAYCITSSSASKNAKIKGAKIIS